jgi:uncharacterized protein with HXXEE motif
MTKGTAPRRSLAPVLWLLPLVFVLHDGEELLTMPEWIAAHRLDLEQLGQQSAVAARLVRSLATTTPEVAVGIGFLFLLVVTVTAGASAVQRPGFWLYAYAGMLGVLFLHVFTHLAQALFFGGYVPGLYGAVLAVLPGSLYIYRRLFQDGLLTWRSATITALIGLGLLLPVALFAHRLGRLLGR